MIEGASKPEAVAETALIYRPEFDPVIEVITPATSQYLLALKSGATLSEPLDEITEIDPEFDLSSAVGLMLQTGLITKIKTNKDME